MDKEVKSRKCELIVYLSQLIWVKIEPCFWEASSQTYSYTKNTNQWIKKTLNGEFIKYWKKAWFEMKLYVELQNNIFVNRLKSSGQSKILTRLKKSYLETSKIF